MGFFELFSLAAGITGLAMQANAARQQSQAAQQAANYNAQIQRNNAQIAEYQAQDALSRGQDTQVKHALATNQLAGRQRAKLAASGVALDEGSALNLQTDTELFAKQDQETIKTNAAREAWGYQVQAQNASAQGNLYSMQAANQNPDSAMAGTLLVGASQVADRWYQYSKRA